MKHPIVSSVLWLALIKRLDKEKRHLLSATPTLYVCLATLCSTLYIPRPRIAHWTPSMRMTFTQTPKLLGQIFLWNLLQQCILITCTHNLNLPNRDFIQPRPHDSPHSRESPRRIDDIEFPHRFWVSVLSDRRSSCDVLFDTVKVGERDAAEVEDGAISFDGVTDGEWTSGKPLCEGFFIFEYETLELTLGGGGCIERFDVQLTKALNVKWSAILIAMISR